MRPVRQAPRQARGHPSGGMKTWIGRLAAAPDALAALMLLALVVVTVVDVVGRYLFRAPIGGADELTVFFRSEERRVGKECA